MREINARSFVNAVFGLGNLEIALKELTDETAKNRTAANELTARLRRFRQELAELEARLTISEVDRFIDRLESYAITVSEFSYFVKSVRLRLQDEMSSTNLLALNSEDQNYFSPRSPLFGDLIPEKFPTNGEFELDEAAKCLALGRPTAAVFHLMRLMEVGIRALARCLQIPDPLKPAERNWGHIIGEIKKRIDARWPTAATRAHGDGALFEQLHASLDAVRNPWRNATMHVESKYTDDQAKHILIAVKGFMEKLASRTDENGEAECLGIMSSVTRRTCSGQKWRSIQSKRSPLASISGPKPTDRGGVEAIASKAAAVREMRSGGSARAAGRERVSIGRQGPTASGSALAVVLCVVSGGLELSQ